MFGDAFDVYLLVLRDVDKKIAKVLGRDGRDWRVQEGCPACGYEVRELQFIVRLYGLLTCS